MLRKVYINHREEYPVNENLFAALDGFQKLGVETAPFYGFGDVETLEDIGPEVCVAGHIGDVWSALKKINVPAPQPIDYPEELASWFGREIKRTTLSEVRCSTKQQFVKPVLQKAFTGFIWNADKSDRLRTATFDDTLEVFTSELIDFRSESRCFILRGEILGVRFYKGDWSKAPDRDVVEAAVKEYKTAPAGYGIDFGITGDGQTLIVEANDGFALGCYGLPSVLYARMIEARWEEMTSAKI